MALSSAFACHVALAVPRVPCHVALAVPCSACSAARAVPRLPCLLPRLPRRMCPCACIGYVHYDLRRPPRLAGRAMGLEASLLWDEHRPRAVPKEEHRDHSSDRPNWSQQVAPLLTKVGLDADELHAQSKIKWMSSASPSILSHQRMIAAYACHALPHACASMIVAPRIITCEYATAVPACASPPLQSRHTRTPRDSAMLPLCLGAQWGSTTPIVR